MNAPDKNRARRFGLIAVLTAFELALVVVACVGRRTNTPAVSKASEYFGNVVPPKGQVFTFNNGAEPEHLDPAIMSGQPDGRIARLVFEGLVNADPNPGNFLVDEQPDGSTHVWCLDFGCAAELPEPVRDADRELWWALVDPDGESAAERFRLGLARSGRRALR